MATDRRNASRATGNPDGVGARNAGFLEILTHLFGVESKRYMGGDNQFSIRAL